MVLRLLTAVGVGAEYAEINAAISEFIPARHRGKTNATLVQGKHEPEKESWACEEALCRLAPRTC